MSKLHLINVGHNEFAKIRCVFIDLDGTVFGHDLVISDEDKKAIQAVQKYCQVMIVTGRPKEGTIRFYQELALKDIYATLNGGLIFDQDHKIIRSIKLEKEDVVKINELQKTYGFTLNFYSDDTWYTTNLDDQQVRREAELLGYEPVLFDDINEILKYDIHKVLLLDKKETMLKLVPLLKEIFPKLIVINNYPTYIELFKPESSKGHGVSFIKERLGLKKEECLSIGDSLIDGSMFDECGIACLMENGNPLLQSRVNCITASHQENGVEKVLNYLIKSKK